MEEVVLRLEKLLFPAIADVAVLSVNVDIEIVRVDAQCTTAGATCPGCGAWSTQVHSSYLRFPADVPSAGRSVVLQIRVRRFRCGNAMCPRRTFVEQIPGLTRRHGRRTERLRSTLAAAGLALAGRAGSRLMSNCRVRSTENIGRPLKAYVPYWKSKPSESGVGAVSKRCRPNRMKASHAARGLPPSAVCRARQLSSLRETAP
ncbi:transposase family protein [Streptomyces sp. NPDC005167]